MECCGHENFFENNFILSISYKKIDVFDQKIVFYSVNLLLTLLCVIYIADNLEFSFSNF